jgi:hypothetical protein
MMKSSRSIFPNRFVPAVIFGLAPVFWAFGWDLSRATGSYPVGIAAGLLWVLVVATAWIARGHPGSRDHATPQPSHPKAWRWFAAASLVLFAFGVVSMVTQFKEKTLYDWLSLPVEAVALAGIYSYGFQRPVLPPSFWRVITPAYCLWTVVSFAMHWQGMMVGFHKANGTATFITALALGIPIIIGIPVLTCLALLRLSWFPPNARSYASG